MSEPSEVGPREPLVSTIHQLLDKHLDLLTKAGSSAGLSLAEPPSELHVRATLRAAGYHDRDDVVGLYTWKSFPDLGERRPELFIETLSPVGLESSIEVHRACRELMAEILPPIEVDIQLDPEEGWPGPPHWLPVAFLDSREFLAVDCRPDPDGGSVWFCFNESANARLFSSLAEALETATYSLESGLWKVANGTLSCDRTSQPSERDLTSPPWPDYHDAPRT